MSFRNTEHKLYRFDQFSLDLDRETLHRDNEEIHLRPQAFAVLKVLLEHSGELVTKNQIHRAVWNNRCVTDASIAHCVADVRRALGDVVLNEDRVPVDADVVGAVRLA